MTFQNTQGWESANKVYVQCVKLYRHGNEALNV